MPTSTQAYRRDRLVVIAGMVVVSLLSWAYMVDLAGFGQESHPPAQGMTESMTPAWDGGLLAFGAVMWSVMMIAMMLPTATPMVLSFTRLQHQRWAAQQAVRSTWMFVAGYLVAWAVFSLLAAGAQWTLYSLGLMTSVMGRTEPLLAGGFLIAAGLFQWSGFKDACLTKCRSPLDFLLNEWREGDTGALIMGLRHGLFCVGCCWMLMLLMFVGGVMDLVWMAAITLYVLAEKLVPYIRLLGGLTGVLLIAAGVLTLALTV